MIILHQGDGASERVAKLVAEAGVAVFRRDPGTSVADCAALVRDWLAERKRKDLATPGRPIIVIDRLETASAAELEALTAVRRMAKWAGADVHLVGGDCVKSLADHVIAGEMEWTAFLAAQGASGAASAGPVEDPPMTPFRPARMDIPTWQEVMAIAGCSEQEARQHVRFLERHKVWVNNLYQVNVEYADPADTGGVGFAHLIIRRHDRRPVRSWQHFQTIKNELIGPECEAVELYPAESQLVDAKDHYHLWAFTSPEDTFGIGFRHGREVKTRK